MNENFCLQEQVVINFSEIITMAVITPITFNKLHPIIHSS